MTFHYFDHNLSGLAQILELENALLKDLRAREAMKYLDEKTRLLMEFYRGGEFLKKNRHLVDGLAASVKESFTLKMVHVQKLAQENESFLKSVSQQSERLLTRIVKNMRQSTSPVQCYTAHGKAQRAYQGTNPPLTGALTLNNRI